MQTGIQGLRQVTSAAWSNDLLDRKSDALFLIDFMLRKIEERGSRGATKSFVLNIDAGWGHGKSYFLQNLKASLEERHYVVAHVNAWNDDHADDPLIAVMSAIDAAVKSRSAVKTKQPLNKLTQIGGQVAAAAAKGAIKQAANRFLGEDAVKEMADIVGATAADVAKAAGDEASKRLSDLYDAEGKALLEKFHVGQRTIKEFRAQLGKVIASFKEEYKRPLFVLIDELDRCRPPYAVALLERVKHLFEVDDVVFVMATDTDQLRHSVEALYGQNFAAGRYLLRFFDQTYRFEDASVDEFVQQQFSDIELSKLYGSSQVAPDEFAATAFKAFHLSLRDIEQCTDIVRNCVTVWKDPSPIVLLVLLPLVILQQQRMIVSFDRVVDRLEERLGPVRWGGLDFNVWDQGTRKLLDGSSAFKDIVGDAMTYNLIRLSDSDDTSAGGKLSRDLFSQELAARYPESYNAKSPPVSLIRKYPALVRSVGRLSPA